MFDTALELLKWSLSHIITWICLNCLIAGAWWFYGQYQAFCEVKVETKISATEFNFEELSKEQLQAIDTQVMSILDERERSKKN